MSISISGHADRRTGCVQTALKIAVSRDNRNILEAVRGTRGQKIWHMRGDGRDEACSGLEDGLLFGRGGRLAIRQLCRGRPKKRGAIGEKLKRGGCLAPGMKFSFQSSESKVCNTFTHLRRIQTSCDRAVRRMEGLLVSKVIEELGNRCLLRGERRSADGRREDVKPETPHRFHPLRVTAVKTTLHRRAQFRDGDMPAAPILGL